MPPVTVFLSCATTEFGPQRVRLDQQLRALGAGVNSQETFRQDGERLLELIDEKVRASEYVIHLIGEKTGDTPPRSVVTRLLDGRFCELPSQVGWGDPSTVDPYALTYTQWEYWLGLFHQKKCIVFVVVAGKDPVNPVQCTHLKSIREDGRLRERPENEWHLVALVMKSLLNLSGNPDATRITPASPDAPAIVLALSATPSGHLLTGGVRLGARQFARLADPTEVSVSKPPALAGALTDLIERCAGALPDCAAHLGPVVELVLPTELLFRPLSDWAFHPQGGRRGTPAPIRDWFPLRLRVADRGTTGEAARTLARRLEKLRLHGHQLTGVGRAIPPAHRGDTNPPPVAVVHDGTVEKWWQHHGAVCGAFTSPPDRPARVRVGARRAGAPSALRQAADHGVPYLVWPERVTVAADELEAHLGRVGLDRLCHYFNTLEFAVLAESDGAPDFDGSPLVSGVTPHEVLR